MSPFRPNPLPLRWRLYEFLCLHVSTRTRWVLGICGVLALIAGCVYWLYRTEDSDDWRRLDEICARQPFQDSGENGDGCIKLAFKDGTWAAILHRSSHDESGHGDHTVGVTSRGDRIESDYHFCGYEGFSCTLDNKEYASFDDFLAKTQECGWKVSRMSPASRSATSRPASGQAVYAPRESATCLPGGRFEVGSPQLSQLIQVIKPLSPVSRASVLSCSQ